jgi:flavodoxin I
MKKIALIYWPKKGNTENAAKKIYSRFNKEQIDMFTIKQINTAEFALYDAYIIGAPTTGADNWTEAYKTIWTDFFFRLTKADIKGKPYAIFGLGDQILYPYNFVDGMIDIKKEFDKNGAMHTGSWPVEGYEFRDSESILEGKFVGLSLDEDQQPELTEKRIDEWTTLVKKDFGIG